MGLKKIVFIYIIVFFVILLKEDIFKSQFKLICIFE
jgi:hypothetical protein